MDDINWQQDLGMVHDRERRAAQDFVRLCPWWMVGQVCRLCSRYLLAEDLITYDGVDDKGLSYVVHLACAHE